MIERRHHIITSQWKHVAPVVKRQPLGACLTKVETKDAVANGSVQDSTQAAEQIPSFLPDSDADADAIPTQLSTADGNAGEIEILSLLAKPRPELNASELADVGGLSTQLGTEFKFHPLAEIFPMADEALLAELTRDIADHGLIEPIMLHDGKILDGRARCVACRRSQVEPRGEQYTGDDPLSFIISRNLRRRHLCDSQRALVGAKLSSLGRGANQHSEGLPIGACAELLNVSERSIARGKELLVHGHDDLVKAVERGEISISRASEISRKPTSEQEYALAAIESEPKARSHRGANITRRKRRARAVDVGGRELVQTLRADLALAKCRVRELEEELALTKATSSAVPDPDSMDLPPSLDRRPLSPEDEDIVAVLTTCWANERQLRRADWENASAVVRHRFIKVLLED